MMHRPTWFLGPFCTQKHPLFTLALSNPKRDPDWKTVGSHHPRCSSNATAYTLSGLCSLILTFEDRKIVSGHREERFFNLFIVYQFQVDTRTHTHVMVHHHFQWVSTPLALPFEAFPGVLWRWSKDWHGEELQPTRVWLHHVPGMGEWYVKQSQEVGWNMH